MPPPHDQRPLDGERLLRFHQRRERLIGLRKTFEAEASPERTADRSPPFGAGVEIQDGARGPARPFWPRNCATMLTQSFTSASAGLKTAISVLKKPFSAPSAR